MKNLFCITNVYFQFLLIRLTPVGKIWLFLKPSKFDKNRLVAFQLLTTTKVISCARNVRERGWPWFIFCHYQLTVVANWLLLTGDKSVATFLTVGLKPIIICQSMAISHCNNLLYLPNNLLYLPHNLLYLSHNLLYLPHYITQKWSGS